MAHPADYLNAVYALALAGLLLAGGCAQEAEQRADAPRGHETPEAAVKAMILGIAARDEAAIRRAILPDEQAAILWAGDPPPAEQAEPLLNALEEEVTARRLAPGDTVPLPGGQEHVLSEEAFREDQQLVVAERNGRPMLAPLFVHRTEDGWRVDAGPVIAAVGLRGVSLPGEEEEARRQ